MNLRGTSFALALVAPLSVGAQTLTPSQTEAREPALRTGGLPTYGLSSVFLDVDDVRAHGRDERIMTKSLDEGVDNVYQLVREIAVAHP